MEVTAEEECSCCCSRNDLKFMLTCTCDFDALNFELLITMENTYTRMGCKWMSFWVTAMIILGLIFTGISFYTIHDDVNPAIPICRADYSYQQCVDNRLLCHLQHFQLSLS